ncbi:MAG TPA: septation protein SpoVG family protein [Phycisphaerae bacterium]|nr:septation protein SpoVG family protein [Phycisphaerae bacterium]
MEITEVRIKLVQNGNERLRAFCSITLNGDFVIRDLKIIDGTNGPFVAMPSRKLMDRCARCGGKNHLRARFCNECGAKLNEIRAPKDPHGRAKLHADVAHPINAACRERVQKAVVEAYQAEVEKAKAPDYRPTSFDDYDSFDEDTPHEHAENASAKRHAEAREPVPAARKTEDTFSDYNELIQDLKREAHQRRPERRGEQEPETEDHPPPFRLDESRQEPPPESPSPPEPVRKPEPAPSRPAGSGQDDFGNGL